MPLQSGTHLQRPASTRWKLVQRRAARFCHYDYRRTSSVTSMIQNLGWEELQHRREQCKTIMMYRIVNDLIDIPAENYLTHSGTTTRVPPHNSINYREKLLQKLPRDIITREILLSFRQRIQESERPRDPIPGTLLLRECLQEFLLSLNNMSLELSACLCSYSTVA